MPTRVFNLRRDTVKHFVVVVAPLAFKCLMGVAQINLLHETMQSIKITNTHSHTHAHTQNTARLGAALCRCLWLSTEKKMGNGKKRWHKRNSKKLKMLRSTKQTADGWPQQFSLGPRTFCLLVFVFWFFCWHSAKKRGHRAAKFASFQNGSVSVAHPTTITSS